MKIIKSIKYQTSFFLGLLVFGAGMSYAGITDDNVELLRGEIATLIGTAGAAALSLTGLIIGWDVGLALLKKFIKKGSK